MSLSYKILKFLLKHLGPKRLFQLSEEELLQKAIQVNKKRKFKIPNNRKAHYAIHYLDQKHYYVMIQTRHQKSDKLILLLYGGGMMLVPDAYDFKTAVDIGRKTGSDVCFLYYPLCPEHNIREIYEVVYACYGELIQNYRAEQISLLGFSSGGALVIGLCQYITEQGGKLPMPRQIVVCSPGGVPLTEKEEQKMQELSERDLLVDATYMSKIRKLMEGREKVPDYMLSGHCGDFTHFPETFFYYGSDEVLYAAADYYKVAYQKYGARCRIRVGEGLCHCYPMFPYFMEAKQAYNEIVDILS